MARLAEWKWSTAKDEAAVNVADDRLTDEEIATKAGVSRETLRKWKDVPEFKDRVQKHVDAFRAKILTKGIADKTRRIERLNRDWNKLQQVIDARAEHAIEFYEKHEREEAPGMLTGTMVKDVKSVGKGEDFQIIEVFAVDTATLSELRNLEMQAAKELGQLTEKHEVDVRDRGIAETLDSKLASLAAKLAAGTVPPEPDQG